jgi:hypothetical protein
MKNLLLLLTFSFCFLTLSAQEYAEFEITATNAGTGTFTNAALPNFSWSAIGAIYKMEVLNDEVFDDGNAFENTFGQADNADNLRTQNYPNGEGTAGDTVLSISILTINFNETTPANGWGFCVTDIDVENCLIDAIDINDEPVSPDIIDSWLVELFDCDLISDGLNIPKWDPVNAALLGSDTPETYVAYDNVIIGGMPASEAAAAFFMPDIPIKQLSVRFENLQENNFTSYHLYIASLEATMVNEIIRPEVFICPVPARDVIRISVSHVTAANPVVEILNPAGERLIFKVMNQAKNEMELGISRLPAGVYFCRVLLDQQTITKKIIKL